MADGVPPPSEVILLGPRGNGKTALLAWLQREIAGIEGIEAVRLTPSEIATPAQLAERLLPESWWVEITPEDVSIAGITWRPGKKKRVPVARDVLAARSGKKPFVLLVDEAHTLAPEVGGALLNASQIVGRELPFLLVLAGTPNLRDQMSRMNASFWSRADQIPVSRLDAPAAAAAIQRPLEEEDVSINDDALDHIVEQSHGYPFFLQLWGSLVWRRTVAAGAGRLVTLAEVEAAQAEFDERRGIYYLQRFNELADQDLLPAARAVADAFAERPKWLEGDLRDLVLRRAGETAGPDHAAGALRVLRQLGFIWQSGADPRWEPGIPSLMDYIREYAPAR